MKNSEIQWCDHTFNPWEGCTKVAPECKNCYAETLVDHRFGRAKWGKGQPRRRTSESCWKQPIAWNRDAGLWGAFHGETLCCKGTESEMRNKVENEQRRSLPLYWHAKPLKERPRVFCLSLGDWLDEEVPIEWLSDLLKLVHDRQNLDWLLLTKRPEKWNDRLNAVRDSPDCDEIFQWIEEWLMGLPPANVWIGVSAGADQKAALDIPAKIHFLSCEPMLYPMELRWAAQFDWIIYGGESGKNARPCRIDWIRDGIQMCRRLGIAPFVKQLGRNSLDPTGYTMALKDSHGADMEEWPEDLRVREFPEVRNGTN